MQARRIVVAVDFSDASVEAVRWTSRVFGADAEIVLAHVIDIPEPPPLVRELSAPTDVLELTAREGADRKLRDIAREAGVHRSRIDIRRGTVADCIVDAADDVDAEMIVVGTHQAREGVWNKLGSTAERIIARSHVPVLLAAHPESGTPSHVLAATDGSDISAAIDEWGERLSRRLNARWTRLSVGATPVPAAPLAEARAVPAGETAAEGSPESAGRDDWISREISNEPANVPVVAFGDAGKEILAAASRYGTGIIVIGRRGAGRAIHALFGRVTKAVLRGAHCPVLVVVEPDRARGDDLL